MGKLEGKVAVITGGARGQGASHVRTFVKEGAKVVFSDILVGEGETLANELGESVKFMKHDVTKADDWHRVIDETEAAFGPIDILVNNAGIVVTKNFEDLSEEEYRKVIDINQVSIFLGMKTVLPSMKKQKTDRLLIYLLLTAFGVPLGMRLTILQNLQFGE